ncbi:3-oxoadipate enol-lactonase [Agaricicola taiwanensis]|uniref:3-oxoadipate enol-lactonase n=1 Tax=Agaricicola taiwanensis TaxID=591372 RepID=A0A8J2VLT2_9RHOB|nr:alpha/beta fold hydrolase [Agaricicola taiwanensis]GGE30799.1 3-oxoadipate enol-lactonase [Agaricicola taiwanensis]
MSITTSGERFVTVGGAHSIFLSERPAVGGALPVLFLNSLAADLTMWDGVRDGLGLHSAAYDARGHGRSDAVAGDATIDEFADDAAAVMAAAGLERAVLCGLSLGGLTAMRLAERMPDRVAGLVLANTAVSFPPAQMWRDRAELARAGSFSQLVQPTLERWLTPSYRQARPDVAEKVREMIQSTAAEGYAAACAILGNADTGQALRDFDGPVLVIAGRHDQSTPIARAEEMVALADNAELLVLEAAHLSAVECAAEFGAALKRFVERAS